MWFQNESANEKFTDFIKLNENELQPYFELAKNAVELYYRSSFDADLSATAPELRISEIVPLADDVNNFLIAKLEYETFLPRLEGYTRSYVNGSFYVSQWKTIGDSLWLEIVASVEYQYSNATVSSGLTDTVFIILNNQAILTDWYTNSNGNFDSQVRGFQLDLTDELNWLSNQDYNVISQNIENI